MTLDRSTPLRRTPFKRTEPKPTKGPRARKCKNRACRSAFVPDQPFVEFCSPDCGAVLAIERLAKQKAARERKETRERKQAMKTRSDWMKEAQAVLNRWIREVRDAGRPCISCGRHHEGQYHAGHYLARGSHPHLALVEVNLAKQCAPCNTHLSGNQLNFRIGLIDRIGIAAVEALEADQTPRKWTIEEIKAIKADYLNRLKEKACSP